MSKYCFDRASCFPVCLLCNIIIVKTLYTCQLPRISYVFLATKQWSIEGLSALLRSALTSLIKKVQSITHPLSSNPFSKSEWRCGRFSYQTQDLDFGVLWINIFRQCSLLLEPQICKVAQWLFVSHCANWCVCQSITNPNSKHSTKDKPT